MYVHMILQITLKNEWLLTYVTYKWPLPTMYDSSIWMTYYIHQQNGCSPPCMRWCVFRWFSWLNDLLHTSQQNSVSPLCSADVSSDYSADWMTYYIHHSKMASPHYVRADVSSDYSAYWMTYNMSHINGHSPLCICWCVFRVLWSLNNFYIHHI
jgi:hypothetical protein